MSPKHVWHVVRVCVRVLVAPAAGGFRSAGSGGGLAIERSAGGRDVRVGLWTAVLRGGELNGRRGGRGPLASRITASGRVAAPCLRGLSRPR